MLSLELHCHPRSDVMFDSPAMTYGQISAVRILLHLLALALASVVSALEVRAIEAASPHIIHRPLIYMAVL